MKKQPSSPDPHAAYPETCIGACSRAATATQRSTAEGTRSSSLGLGPEAIEQRGNVNAESECRSTQVRYSEVQRSIALGAMD